MAVCTSNYRVEVGADGDGRILEAHWSATPAETNKLQVQRETLSQGNKSESEGTGHSPLALPSSSTCINMYTCAQANATNTNLLTLITYKFTENSHRTYLQGTVLRNSPSLQPGSPFHE